MRCFHPGKLYGQSIYGHTKVILNNNKNKHMEDMLNLSMFIEEMNFNLMEAHFFFVYQFII